MGAGLPGKHRDADQALVSTVPGDDRIKTLATALKEVGPVGAGPGKKKLTFKMAEGLTRVPDRGEQS